MQIKLIFVLILLVPCLLFSKSLQTQACYLKVILTDGTKHSIPLSNIKKMTFSHINTSVSANESVQNIIKNFMLFQNYPNPFNQTTTIEYHIATAGEVEIFIFNIGGQLVRTIALHHQLPGVYRTTWDGKNGEGKIVASGLYIYHLKFGNTIHSKRMILIK